MYGVYKSNYAKEVTPGEAPNIYSGLEPNYQPFKAFDAVYKRELKVSAKNQNLVENEEMKMQQTLKKGFGVRNPELFSDAMDTKGGKFFNPEGTRKKSTDIDFGGKSTLKGVQKLKPRFDEQEDLERESGNYMDDESEEFVDENIQVRFKNGKLFSDSLFENGVEKNKVSENQESTDYSRLNLQENRKYRYLKNQYDTYLKGKVSQAKNVPKTHKIKNSEKIQIQLNDLYNEWRFAKEKFPKAYNKFMADFLTEDEKNQKNGDFQGENFTQNLRILDKISLPATENAVKSEFKPIRKAHTMNLLLPRGESIVPEDQQIFKFPGNNNFQAPNFRLQAILKIQSWFRGCRSRKLNKDLRFLFRNRRPNPELQGFTITHRNLFEKVDQYPLNLLNTGTFNSVIQRAVEPTHEMRGTANFNLNLEDYSNSNLKSNDKIENLKCVQVTDQDLLNYKNRQGGLKSYNSQKKYSYLPEKKLTYQSSYIETLLDAKKDKTKPEIFIGKSKRGKRIYDILFKKSKRSSQPIGLDNLDWTAEVSKSRDLKKSVSKKKLRIKTGREFRASVDTFKYSRDNSISDGIDDPFANQTYKFTDRSHRSQKGHNLSKSVAFKNSVESEIPMELNMGQSYGKSEASIPMEMDFDNIQKEQSMGDSEGVIRFSNSGSNLKQSRSRTKFDNFHQSQNTLSGDKWGNQEESIEMEIDEEIEDEFEQNFNESNKLSMKKMGDKIAHISSSGVKDPQVKAALDSFKFFVKSQTKVFDQFDKISNSEEKEVLKEVKNNQRTADKLIDKMDKFIYNQNVEKKLDILISKRNANSQFLAENFTSGSVLNQSSVSQEMDMDNLKKILKKSRQRDKERRELEKQEIQKMMDKFTDKIDEKFGTIVDKLQRIEEERKSDQTEFLRKGIFGGKQQPESSKSGKMLNFAQNEIFPENSEIRSPQKISAKKDFEVEQAPELAKFNDLMASFENNYNFVLEMEESVDAQIKEMEVNGEVQKISSKIDDLEEKRIILERERREKQKYIAELNHQLEIEKGLAAGELNVIEESDLGNLNFENQKNFENAQISNQIAQNMEDVVNQSDYLSANETQYDISWADTLNETEL